MKNRRLPRPALAALAATMLLGACAATPPYEAQWTDPQLGAKSGQAAPRTSPGQARPAPTAAPAPRPQQTLTNDWFAAALNKKR